MSKLKIAILSDWYLPGTKAGGPVRSIFSLIELLKDDLEIHLITTNCDLGSAEQYKGIGTDKPFLKEGIHYYYFSPAQLKDENVLNYLQQLNPDLIYLNSFWSWHFSIAIVRAKKNGLLKSRVLLAPRGMLGQGAMSLKSFKKQLFLWVGKLMGWYRQIPFHATNEQEKKDILSRFPSAKVFVVPNVNSGKTHFIEREKKSGELKLFYLSRIARVKNLHFALNVLSFVPKEFKIEYHIYGNAEDLNYLKECEHIISKLPSNISVKILGELAFDRVQHTILNYHALLLPTLNENFGHSIVESLLCGCPVIISDQTPWSDLEKNNAGYALSLENRSGFEKAIESLAASGREEYLEKSKAAINYISERINPEKTAELYKKMFHESGAN